MRIARSIARIHRGNLINHGIVPMLFENREDYDWIEQEDILTIHALPDQIKAGRVCVENETEGRTFWCKLDLSRNEMEVALAGGQLRYLKNKLAEM